MTTDQIWDSYITYMGFAAAAVHKRRTFGQGQGETEFAVRKHEEGNSIQELVPEA